MQQPHTQLWPVRAPVRALLLCAALLPALAACGDGQQEYDITEVREFAPDTGGHDPHAGLFGGPHTGATDHGLAWTAPEGWVEQPPRPMRLVTFKTSASSETECYVSRLGPEAGDIAANLDYWRRQMGKPPLDVAEFAKLPRIQVLGLDLPVLQVEGAFRGEAKKQMADALLLGLACPQKDHALFVKMIGPKAEVLPLRPAFEAFCRSLRRAK